MKLGLLVVLAVVVLVPSLSEGRVISRCELKEKLEEEKHVPRKPQKFKDRILAKVICEVERSSRLNTCRVIGDRRPTVKQTVPELTQAAAVAGVKNRITGIHPLYTEITEPFTTNGIEDKFNGRESNENSYASYEVDHSQEFFLNDEESKFDEEEIEQDDNRMIDEEDSEKEDGQELELEEVIGEVERSSRLNTRRVIGDRKPTVKQTVPELTQAAAVAGVKNRITGIHPLYTEITEPFITNGIEDKFNGRESNENSYASYEVDHSQEFFLNDEESKFDEEEIEQDDNRMIDEEDSEKEDGQELELEEGGEHKKKSLPVFGRNRKAGDILYFS